MKRSIKNLIMCITLVLIVFSMYFTITIAKNSINTNNVNPQVNNMSNDLGGSMPPDIPSTSDGGAPPGMNESGNSKENTPPEIPNMENSNETGDVSQNENGESSKTPNMKARGDKKRSTEKTDEDEESIDNNENNSNMNDKMPNMNGNRPDINKVKDNNINSNIGIIYYILFGIESLALSLIVIYLLMSKFNKKTFKETLKTKDKIIIGILSTIILTSITTFISGYITKNIIKNDTQLQTTNSSDIQAQGSVTVKNNQTLTDEYETSNKDENVILVDGGKANIKGATIKKSGGDSSNTENSEFHGINAGILVKSKSSATIKKAKISTNAKGSNAVFSTGEDSKIYISDSEITTTGSSSSRGLDATYGGYIEADNVNIKTDGASSATLATDRGEGTVIASNMKLETNGSGSPIIYSTGDIQITDTTGSASSSQMIVIEGKNSATVKNSTLSASAKGNRGDVDQAGVMIYQSMSGDANVGEGILNVSDSTLEISSSSDYYKTAPMFFITNTDAVINMENTKLIYGSNILISSKATSEWGSSDRNGGNIELNAKNQELVGNIEVDKISSVSLNLTKSNYKGGINSENTGKEVNIKLDKDSTITLISDSYVTSLEDEDSTYSNINFNGYKLYVNDKSIN